jgi:hypothetical protein
MTAGQRGADEGPGDFQGQGHRDGHCPGSARSGRSHVKPGVGQQQRGGGSGGQPVPVIPPDQQYPGAKQPKRLKGVEPRPCGGPVPRTRAGRQAGGQDHQPGDQSRAGRGERGGQPPACVVPPPVPTGRYYRSAPRRGRPDPDCCHATDVKDLPLGRSSARQWISRLNPLVPDVQPWLEAQVERVRRRLVTNPVVVTLMGIGALGCDNHGVGRPRSPGTETGTLTTKQSAGVGDDGGDE